MFQKKSALAYLGSLMVLYLFMFVMACPALAAKDRIVLAVGGESEEGYDPLLGWGSYGNSLFHSTLLKRDADLKIVPELAREWTLSKDKLTWTVKIREGVVFSDGLALTAGDVAFTFNKGLEAGGKIDLSPLESAKALDKTTVALKLKTPDITFIQHLITLGIVPEKLYGPGYARAPIGSGPYKLVRWDEGQQMVVETNDRYYGTKPAIRQLVFLFSEEDVALAAARALHPKTQYLLCDEMTSMLDALTQAMIWKVVLNIAEKRNLGLLVISHDGALISSLCRRTLDYFIQPG